MTPRVLFEQELEQLHEYIVEMGRQIEKTYSKLFRSIGSKDENELIQVYKSDHTLSEMQHKIESSCLKLITKQQPIARDLRMVTAALKVVTDMQRVGDHCSDIADLVLRLKMKEMDQFSMHLSAMIIETGSLSKSAVDAFVNRDIEAAREVIAGDDVVDNLFNLVKDDLIECLRKNSMDADECVDVLMIAKYLEKIGDHAVNIGEWGIFQETGNIRDTRLL